MAPSITELRACQVPLIGIRQFTTTAVVPPTVAEKLSIKRNLFGSPDPADTADICNEENQRNILKLTQYGIRLRNGEQRLQSQSQSAQIRRTLPVPAATINRSSGDTDAASSDRDNRKPYSKQSQMTDNFNVRKRVTQPQRGAKPMRAVISSTSATPSLPISTDPLNPSALPSPHPETS